MPRGTTSFGAKSEPSLSGLSLERHFLLIAVGLTQTTFLPPSVLQEAELQIMTLNKLGGWKGGMLMKLCLSVGCCESASFRTVDLNF